MEYNYPINLENIKKQLELLFSGVKDEKSKIVLFSKDTRGACWFDWDDLEGLISKAGDLCMYRQNAYFSLLPQNYEEAIEIYKKKGGKENNYSGRGTSDSATCIPSLFIDIDVAGKEHASDNLPPTFEDATNLLKAVPFTPSIIINSGGGLHVYWCLKEPFYFKNKEDQNQAKKILASFQKLIIGEGAKNGWHVDNTANLAQMLRVAGTFNFKDPKNPKEVKIVEINENNRYSFDEIKSFLSTKENENSKMKERSKKKENRESSKIFDSKDKKSEYPKSWAKEVLNECEFIKHCEINAKTLIEPEWHSMICILALCEEGQELIQKLSEPYNNYDPDEVKKKIRQFLESGYGPRTCESINNDTCEKICTKCKHWGNIKSPIVLGYKKDLDYLDYISIADEVIEKIVNGDFGAHLEQKAINAFANIKKISIADFARYKKKMQDLKIPINDFNKKIMGKFNELKKEKKLALRYDDYFGELYLPPDYIVHSGKIVKLSDNDNEQDKVVCNGIIKISEKYSNIIEGIEEVKVEWNVDQEWNSKIVERNFICETNKIVSLSAFGFPVNSVNAADIVSFLSEFETYNYCEIPNNFVTNVIGWNKIKNEKFFVIGEKIFGTSDNVPNVKFKALSSGDSQIASAFEEVGNFDKWKETINLLNNFPRSIVGLYASFSPVLLDIIGCSNFCFELANRTSSGKSTNSRIQASVWGQCDERLANSVIQSWDNTQVFIERIAGMLSGIPLILDDTKGAKNKDIVPKIFYTVTSGRGRGRGNLKGIATTKSWKTVLLSTGEIPGIHFSNDGGTRGRVLEITGKPFNEISEETRKIVLEIDTIIKNNYGHAGPKFVEFITLNSSKWVEWKELYKSEELRFSTLDNGSEVAGRLASYMALLSLTGKLIHEALDLDFKFNIENINFVWKIVTEESKDVLQAEKAFCDVVSWAQSNKNTFLTNDMNDSLDYKYTSISGVWKSFEGADCIAFFPHVLEKILKDNEFLPREILKVWAENKWLKVTDSCGNNHQMVIRIKEKTTRVYMLKMTEYLKIIEKSDNHSDAVKGVDLF